VFSGDVLWTKASDSLACDINIKQE
jgi:hypothetical protein